MSRKLHETTDRATNTIVSKVTIASALHPKLAKSTPEVRDASDDTAANIVSFMPCIKGFSSSVRDD